MGQVEMCKRHADILARTALEAHALKPGCLAMDAAAAIGSLLPYMNAWEIAWELGNLEATIAEEGIEYDDSWQYTVDAEPWVRLAAAMEAELNRRTK